MCRLRAGVVLSSWVVGDGGRARAVVWGVVGGDAVGGPKVRARRRGRALRVSGSQSLTKYQTTNVTVQGSRGSSPREDIDLNGDVAEADGGIMVACQDYEALKGKRRGLNRRHGGVKRGWLIVNNVLKRSITVLVVEMMSLENVVRP